MAFACQRNSYLKDLVAKVISCVRVKDGFEVVLDDTVLFPEGGGQPDDRGCIGDSSVSRVLRRGGEAVHVVDKEVSVGSTYKCEIDWQRRFDHMQQHSGQHLLSAIAYNLYGFKTLSWDLGKEISHVELSTNEMTSDQINKIEEECNVQIRNHLPVVVHYLSKSQALDLEEVKTRGLPDDVIEPIRVIEIQGIEKNMCCGTHVCNLSDVQVIKLFHTEPMRGNTRLFFRAGHRVLLKLAALVDVEKKLTKLLSCSSEEHADSVDKLKSTLRSSQKANRSYLKEIARFEAREKMEDKTSKFIFQHREDADMDYISAFLSELDSQSNNKVVFVSGGPVNSGGQFILRAPEEELSRLSPRIVELLNGKGGGKKGQFQGKANSFKKLNEVKEVLEKHVSDSVSNGLI